MDLLRVYPPDLVKQGLGDWAWIGLDGLEPHSASPFADQFLVGRGAIWMLDMLEGTLAPAFPDRDAMVAALATEDGLDRYLLGGMAEAAEQGGLVLGPTQTFAWKIPPVLGGTTTLENVEVLDLVVWMSIMGQIHQQVKDLPPGTPIHGVTVNGQDPTPDRRRRWGRK